MLNFPTEPQVVYREGIIMHKSNVVKNVFVVGEGDRKLRE